MVNSEISSTPAHSLARPKLDFQAVVLAGGLGTRMLPLTETVPKPMIAVGSKPFLQHQMELLKSRGIDRVLLLVSYLGKQIEQFFGDGSGHGLRLSYSYEASPLGTGGALKNAQARLEDAFLLLNGDTFLDVDYAAMVKDFQKDKPAALIVANQGSANNLVVEASGLVTSYRKGQPQGMTHTDCGAIILERNVLDHVPQGQRCSLEEEIFPQFIERKRMRAWITAEPFFDMGSREGLKALVEKLA